MFIDYIIILATVITNLLSAIPFIGGDLVPLSVFLPLYLYILNFTNIISVYNDHTLYKNNQHVNDYNFNYIDKNLLALIVGFIDGDGYIRITKKTKINSYVKKKTDKYGYNTINKVDNIDYIYISLIINLKENDIELLKYFQKHLNIGKVYNITPKKGSKLARWEINKTDLFNIFVPLLEYYNIKFLIKIRQEQFLLLKYIKYNKLIKYEDIIKNKSNINEYIENNLIYNNFNKLYYFNNWLVGFTMAEGSFLIKKNKDICFQLKQKYNFELFYDIIKLFNTSSKLYIYKNKYVLFSVSSINDIQNIINFFSFSYNHPLLGYKLLSYNSWLLAIKYSSRYNICKIS